VAECSPKVCESTIGSNFLTGRIFNEAKNCKPSKPKFSSNGNYFFASEGRNPLEPWNPGT